MIVATANINHGAERGLAAILETLTALDWDLLAVQEVDRFVRRSGGVDQFKELLSLGDGYFFKALNFQGGAYGQALLYRDLAPPRTETISLPRQEREEQRVASRAEFADFSLVATHLDCHRARAQANLTRLLTLPASLIVGDFNLAPQAIELPSGFEMANKDKVTFPASAAAIDNVLYRSDSWQLLDSWTAPLPGSDHLCFFAELTSLR